MCTLIQGWKLRPRLPSGYVFRLRQLSLAWVSSPGISCMLLIQAGSEDRNAQEAAGPFASFRISIFVLKRFSSCGRKISVKRSNQTVGLLDLSRSLIVRICLRYEDLVERCSVLTPPSSGGYNFRTFERFALVSLQKWNTHRIFYYGAVQKSANLAELENAAKRTFASKNRLRCSRKRALQNLASLAFFQFIWTLLARFAKILIGNATA